MPAKNQRWRAGLGAGSQRQDDMEDRADQVMVKLARNASWASKTLTATANAMSERGTC